MRTVAANVQQLIRWNRSMAVALENAEDGSEADICFIEKLRQSAAVLGYSLTLCKEPKRASMVSKAKAIADKAFVQAIKDGRLSEDPRNDNYTGKYMYMGKGKTSEALFKNINTRKYDV